MSLRTRRRRGYVMRSISPRATMLRLLKAMPTVGAKLAEFRHALVGLGDDWAAVIRQMESTTPPKGVADPAIGELPIADG